MARVRTVSIAPLASLHGAALDDALARRFTLVEQTVAIAGRPITLQRPENADTLISEADYVMDERLPYWADLWPSARVLAAALLREAGRGRTLLELGCGLGLATIAAMEAGFDVTATDYYDDALHMTRANAARATGREPQVRMVNWRTWPDDFGPFDVVIAADVLYEKEYALLVPQCLARGLAPGGEAIVADPGRLALPAFLEALGPAGLVLHDRTRVPFEDGAVKQEVQLLRISRAG